MNKSFRKNNLILAAVFLAVLILPSVLWATIGDINIGAKRLEEKRTLEVFPEEISDGCFAQIGTWFSDHAPYRSTIISEYSALIRDPDLRYREGLRSIYAEHFVPEWYRMAEQNEPYCLPFIKNDVIYGRDDWLFFNGEGATGFYLGNNLLSETDMQEWKETYQELQAECDKRGIKLVVVIAPDKELVYPEEMPSLPVVSEVKRMELFEEYMKDSGVTFLYPREELIAAKEYGVTYYKQDSHWDEYGAYIAIKAINDALGNEMPGASGAKIVSSDYFGGDLAAICGFGSEYKIDSVEYKPDVKVERESYEKGYIEKFSTDADTDAKLVMISDSFRENCREYLVKDYKESAIIHRKMLKKKKTKNAVRDLKENDVLLMLATERYDLDNVGAAEMVLDMLKQ